jgi:AcrR family transcriptional regulator
MAGGGRKYHHGDVPGDARKAALALVEAEGVEALTMRALAKAVGVDHRALYRHYADRETVLADVAAEGYRLLLAAQRRACESADAPLRRAFACYVDFALERPALHGLMLTRSNAAIAAGGALGEAVQAELGQLMVWSRDALGAAPGTREEDARDLAFAGLAAAYGLVSLAATSSLAPRSPEALRAFVTEQVDHALSGQLMRLGAN